jgi:hypothetical protein
LRSTRDYNDIIGGVLMIIGGTWFSLHGLQYSMGTLRRMGPAYFPVCIGITVALFGVLLLLPALRRPGGFPKPEWRPMAAICIAILAFAIGIDRLGLVPATVVLTILAALAERRPPLLPTAILAVALAAIAVLVFTQGLGIPLPAFRWNL